MAGPNSKRPPNPFPKAGALKSGNESRSRGSAFKPGFKPGFKEDTSSYDAGAALKLRDPLPTETPTGERDESLFASLYAPETKNKLALVDPQEKTQALTRSRSKTEKDAPGSETAQSGRVSARQMAIEPTLSPSAIGKLKDHHQKNQNLAATEVSDPKRKKSSGKAKPIKPGESIHDAETRVTRVSQTSAQERAAREKMTGVTVAGAYPRAKASAQEDKDRSLTPILLIAVVTIGLVYFLLAPTSHVAGPSHHSKFSEDEEKALVQMHRFETGSELNSGRTAAEYKNLTTAPVLPSTASRTKTGSMMDGLPLQQENNLRTSARDRLEAANPDDPDHRVEYILQDEQQANEWEEKAQKEYMREFVKNAQDAGYQLRIYDNMDIEVKRAPSSSRGGHSGNAGAGSRAARSAGGSSR